MGSARKHDWLLATAIHYTITDRESRQHLGHATLCVAARYASVALVGAERLERRFTTPALWEQAKVEVLTAGLGSAPLLTTSAIAQIVSEPPYRHRRVLQFLTVEPFESVDPFAVAPLLDRRLRAIAGLA